MFGKSAKSSSGSTSSPAPSHHGDQKIRSAQIDTIIGKGTTIDGDLRFSGGLHVEGVIKGNLAADGDNATLILSEHGHIQGEVRVPSMVLNGAIDGDVFAGGKVELFEKARICGDVYYNLLEMAVGAEVNGKLVRQKPESGKFAPPPVPASDSE
ncbi:MAG: polymer-forming cytoskeletal protein [Candidatus Thiothrix putei]|uniref:Protein CcmA, bactofilin family n=2 Tax=Thiothrix TaxID=1030 RepID=A0A1H3VXE3_9GAMM|nr:polymer-forming cytoskeletal protein [Thiothrix caldifontis]WGZ93681.1 MAG: polymer-forming cytoskeletal protein [Candidatus Thiothrix putei]SDZ78874.1 protein CcmA, bactofilin family [Thiothrix caldifontis]